MEDYAGKLASVTQISGLLSAKPEEVFQAVERMRDENTELKHEVAVLRTERLECQTQDIPQECGNVCRFEENLSPEFLRRTAVAFSERCGGAAAVFSGSDKAGYRYAVASAGGDVRAFGKELNASFSGRGGGPKGLVQGSLSAASAERLKAFLLKRDFSVK